VTLAQPSTEKWQNSSLEISFLIILIIIMLENLVIMTLSAQGNILRKTYGMK